jgi:pimeloyl-ACP methyl ester carboxylesterase
MNDRRVTVDGLNIRYLEEGSGPVVLLVHGGTPGFSAALWRGNMTALAKAGYRAIAYDQPGFGHSDAPRDFAFKYRQDFLPGFCDAIGVSKPALVGHSQGGGLVVGAALDAPARYAGIVVLGTGSLLPPAAGAAKEVEPPLTEPDLEDTKALLQSTTYNHALLTPEVLADYHAMSTGRNFHNAVRRAEAAAAQGKGPGAPLWQRLGEVAIPSLFIYGANDRGDPKARVELARQRYPGLVFHLLERCHHMVLWDRADDVNRLLIHFFEGLKADGYLARADAPAHG